MRRLGRTVKVVYHGTRMEDGKPVPVTRVLHDQPRTGKQRPGHV
jgi:hypothetical protein